MNKKSPNHYSLKAAAGSYGLHLNSVAMIHQGETLIGISDTVGRSHSQRLADDSIKISIPEKVLAGRENERTVLQTLAKAMLTVIEIKQGEDKNGSDGIFVFNEHEKNVQIVSVPIEQDVWRKISVGSYEGTFTAREAANHIHRSIEHKKSVAGRGDIILALDIRHFGLFSKEDVVQEYRGLNASAAQYGFYQIWLVGPTIEHCACLT